MKSGLYNTLFYCGTYFSAQVLWDDNDVIYVLSLLTLLASIMSIIVTNLHLQATPVTSIEIDNASDLAHTNIPL